MTTALHPARKAIVVLGGLALATTAFLLRGIVPELVRYVRIRRM